MKWANDLFWRAHSLLRFEFNEGSLGNDTGFKFLEIIAKSSGGIDKGAVQENTQSFLFALSIWYLSEKPYEHGGAKWILKTYFNIDLDKQDVRRQFYEQIDNWLDDKIDGLTDSGAHSVSSSAVKSAASPAGAPVYGSMAEDDFIKKSTDWLIGRVKEAWYHRPGGSGEFRPYLPRAALHDTTKGKIAEKKKKKLMGGLVNGLVWYANVRAVTVRGQGKSIDKKRYIDTGMDFLDGAIKDDRVGFTDWTETDPAERDKSFPCSDLTQLVSWLADLREFYETVRHAVEDPVEEAIPPHDVGGEVSSSAAANPAGKEAAYPVRDGGIKMGDINLARSGASSGIKFAALGPEFFEHLKFTILAIKEIPSLGEYASLP
jgi:hypothetical protein